MDSVNDCKSADPKSTTTYFIIAVDCIATAFIDIIIIYVYLFSGSSC